MSLWNRRSTHTATAATGAGPDHLEHRTQEIGHDLLARSLQHRSGPLSASFWSDRLMARAMQDEAFKIQLFRFVDVFPVLKTPQAIGQHLAEYLRQPGIHLPSGLSLALSAGQLIETTAAGAVGSQIQSMAGHFIAGAEINDAVATLAARWKQGMAFSVDLLGEACVSDAEAQAYRSRYLWVIQALPGLTAAWPDNPAVQTDHLGALPRHSVSIKISSLDGHVSPADFAGSLQRLTIAILPVLEAARQNNVLIYFDMEQHALKELTFELFKTCCQKIDFPMGIALQSYLTSADQDARDLIDWARSVNRTVYVRLIKGAYWDYETVYAQMMNWPVPVWRHKHETDACFERLTRIFVDNMPRSPGQAGVKLALGTHNVRSVAHAMACIEAAGLSPRSIEFQTLRGMAEELKQVLVETGYRVREYVPIGALIPGMAYLVRRLLENTSNESFLRASHTSGVSDDELLAAPHPPSVPPPSPQADTRALSLSDPSLAEGQPFRSEPRRDFADSRQRDAFAAAITSVSLPPPPHHCTPQEAQETVGIASDAFAAWRDQAPQSRCQMILRAAGVLRSRRDALCGLMIREAGKTWAEADADVCESIDFCEFYAREALALFQPQRVGRFTGERNVLTHEPRGVAVVISPWNFPLAIATGMTVAALVTGNTALLKPAEQTPIIARQLCDALWEAGVPRQVLHLLPGPGEIIGAQLVRDPRVALVAFTGSAAVGLDILHATAPRADGPPVLPIKHVVCEMGGKNAIIVDSSADLDEAVLAVRHSAFSYAGQKCSACSRVIVVEDVLEQFTSRLVDSTRSLVVGDPLDAATDIGPVIDAEAGAKIRQYIEIGRSEATLVLPDDRSEPPASAQTLPNLILPHIFVNVAPMARIATEEIFGPVLCILRARTFVEALAIANQSPYKLTGGLFSRTPSHIEKARREFRVGDLYINRGITGALVGRQPFGGFGLSGLGTQAGGREYLLQFVQPRLITENTLRRGFAPSDDALSPPC